MAEALTYTSLLSDVQVYSEQDDGPFVTQIPRLIMLAENRLASEVRGLGFVRVVSTNLSGSQLAKPARWRETRSFSIDVGGTVGVVYLQPRGYQYCRAFNPTSTSGVPRYYSDEDYEHWFLAPVPNAAYAAEIQYHERPEPLSATNETNWTTQYAPQLLLYATLLEAQPFLKTSERIAEFQALFDRALVMVTKEEQSRLQPDAASLRR